MGRESLNYRRGRSGRPFQREKARCYAQETHCRKCGRPVDKTIPYRDPITGKVNIWSKSYGHAEELDAGGHPYVGHLEHLHCNTSAGAAYRNRKYGRGDARLEGLRSSPDMHAEPADTERSDDAGGAPLGGLRSSPDLHS